MAVLHNGARMSTATKGTGTITLLSAVPGHLTFDDAGAQDQDSVSYGITDGDDWEAGRGTYTKSGTTLTRSVLKSTNSDAAIDLSGSAEVYITIVKEDLTDIVENAAFGAGWNGDTIHAPSQNAVYDKFVTADAVAALNTTHRGSSGADHAYLDQAVTIAGTPTFADLTVSGVATPTLSTTQQSVLELHRDTAVDESDLDVLFQFDDDAGNPATYANIEVKSKTQTAGAVWGSLDFYVVSNGAARSFIQMGGAAGIRVNREAQNYDFVVSGDTDLNLVWVDAANDAVTVGSNNELAKLGVDGNANEIQALFQAVAGQTADIVVVEASDGYDWFVVEADGQVRISSTEQEVLRVHRDANTVNNFTSLVYQADNDANAIADYVRTSMRIKDNSAGAEHGEYRIEVNSLGAFRTQLHIDRSTVTVNFGNDDVNFQVRGDTLTHMVFTDANAATENIALLTAALPNWQTMDRGLFIGDTSQVPTGNPANGGFLYVEAGALKFRGSGGTITELGAA